jgi:RND superfamily putative drug exporter
MPVEESFPMRVLASWCVRHRRLVVLFWVAALIVVTALSRQVGSDFSNSFSLPKTQSTEAIQLLEAVSPKVSGDTEQIVFGTSHGATVTDPAVRARVEAMLAKVAKVPHVTTIVSPYGPAGASHVSKDGTVAFATVTFDRQAQNISTTVANDLVHTAQSADGPDLQRGRRRLGGRGGQQAVLRRDRHRSPPGRSRAVARLRVDLRHGSPPALGRGIARDATGLIALLSHVMKMPEFSTSSPSHRPRRGHRLRTVHRDPTSTGSHRRTGSRDSIVNAVNTSGRAVLFAGIIVCIALLGMFALGVSFLYGLAVSAALGVALTMIAALTLLPALLGFIGPGCCPAPEDEPGQERPPHRGRGDHGVLAPVGRLHQEASPTVPAIAAVAIIILIALPFFSLRLGSSDQGNDPVGTTTRQAYDMLAKGFGPGFNGPLQLVTEGSRAADQAALARVVTDVTAQPDVARVTAPGDPHQRRQRRGPRQRLSHSAPQDAATTTSSTTSDSRPSPVR